jgi:signal transduction histidine kinase/signal recognition particle receptor subunit beta
MAQWSHGDKTLYAKLVYYGPAYGGKTTNLESLHRLTDPSGEQRLLSVKTSGDRTLFFDLLPFDLGKILGYQVGIKIYTVPGQVRYDTTRQIVLAGADAVVFVADSTSDREEQNRWSLQNLTMNMRSQGMESGKVPVLYQFNKQDRPDAADPAAVARWLKADPDLGFPAVATEGQGVLDTFMAAAKAMLGKIYENAESKAREGIDSQELARHVDRALAPFMGRVLSRDDDEAGAGTSSIVLDGEDLLADAIKTQTELGERYSEATHRLKRMNSELDALRRQSESLIEVGACFESERVVEAALETTASILDAGAVSLISRKPLEDPIVERCWGRVQEPLLASAEGVALLEKMMATGGCVVDELLDELTVPASLEPLSGLRAAACVPTGADSRTYLVAYAEAPDGAFHVEDIRFLKTVGAHLEVGLDRIRMHQELAAHRDRLEQRVGQRTEALRRAYDDLKEMEQTKDRLLNNLSHEMRTPLTAMIGAATFMKDYRSNVTQRGELTESILESAETLQKHLDQLLRLADFEGGSTMELAATTGKDLIDAAVSLCETDRIDARMPSHDEDLRLDQALVARAVSNLLDNAVKFSSQDAPVEIELKYEQDGVVIVVSDRGCGVDELERTRIFAPFEQGNKALTDKPGGMGMGLYEAESIAKRHGGTLEYEPRQEGGSRFVLTLPGTRIDSAELEKEAAHA